MTAAPVAVVGGGAWGTALANAAALAGSPVVLWLRDAAQADLMRRDRVNQRYLPGVPLQPRVTVTSDEADLAGSHTVLMVVPAQQTRASLERLGGTLASAATIVLCSKGIEQGTGRFMSDVVGEQRPGGSLAVLSGPGFADDVARGLPTAVTLACRDAALAASIATALSGPSFRVYSSTDVRGVEIGGATKNVLAIACGIVEGRGLGESARAALTSRGFAELMRFASAFGGRPETLVGLSGLGDVILSCGSAHSRNFAFGQRLGQGASIAEAGGGRLAEGALTAGVLVALARRKGLDMPVAAAVDAVISGRLAVGQAIDALMARPLRSET